DAPAVVAHVAPGAAHRRRRREPPPVLVELVPRLLAQGVDARDHATGGVVLAGGDHRAGGAGGEAALGRRGDALHAPGVDHLDPAVVDEADDGVVDALGLRVPVGEHVGRLGIERRLDAALAVAPRLDAAAGAVVHVVDAQAVRPAV